MPIDGSAFGGDPELSPEMFDNLREKLEQQLRNDPTSINPVLITLAEQHAVLHQKINAQAESYSILMQLHIRREEIAILEKLEFAETIKAYQLKLIEGKKLRNRQDRLNDIEKSYSEKRIEAQTATAVLKEDIETFNQIKTGMDLSNGKRATLPRSLTTLNLDAPFPESSFPGSSQSSTRQRDPETENIVEPMTDILVECLEESKRTLKDKDQEISTLQAKIAEFEAKEEEWKKAEARRVEEDEERKRKEARDEEMERKRVEDPTLSSLYAETDRLNLQLVKCYAGLASYQKTNQRLTDMLFLAEKTANVDRIQAADTRHTLKNEINKLDANYLSPEEIRAEFQAEMLNIEKRMVTSNENLKELKENLEAMCVDTFGETTKVVGGANWSARTLQEAFAHKPVLSGAEQELAEKKKELRELKEQLKVLESEYQRALNPNGAKSSDVIVGHLLMELDLALSNMKAQMEHHASVVDRCKSSEEDGIELRRSYLQHMTDLSRQVTSVTGLTAADLDCSNPIWNERIADLVVDLERFVEKETSLRADMETMIDAMMMTKAELSKQFEEGIVEEIAKEGEQTEEQPSEEKLQLKELREKYRTFEATLKEMEKAIDPTIPRLNRQLTHMFGEQQASYALLVERYISGEDQANDERRRAADTIRQLRVLLLDGKKGKDRQKKILDIDREYKERLEVVQQKHREVKKVVDEMKTELENLSMETFGEALEEGDVAAKREENAMKLKISDYSGPEDLIKRLFHKVSFSAGVINTALERLINQVKINMRHDERDIRTRALGYVLEVDEEHNLKNIADLTKFLSSMQKTKVTMGDYFESALKEADERGIDFSLVPMDYDASEQKYKVPNINKTPAETLAQTIANNRKTREFFNMSKAPTAEESSRRLEQRLFVANLNIQEREKQMAEMKQRMEITENVMKARHQQEIEKLKKEMTSQSEGGVSEAPAQALVNKPATASDSGSISFNPAAHRAKAEQAVQPEPEQPQQVQPEPQPALSQGFPVLNQKTIDDIRESIVRAIYEAAGCDISKSTVLMTRLLAAFTSEDSLKEETDVEEKKLLEARIDTLQKEKQTVEKKLEDMVFAYLDKERQVVIMETGYLRRGLGMSRRQLVGARTGDQSNGGMRGLKNSTNQSM